MLLPLALPPSITALMTAAGLELLDVPAANPGDPCAVNAGSTGGATVPGGA